MTLTCQGLHRGRRLPWSYSLRIEEKEHSHLGRRAEGSLRQTPTLAAPTSVPIALPLWLVGEPHRPASWAFKKEDDWARKPRAAPTPSTWEPRPMKRQADGKGWGVLENIRRHHAPCQC